MDNFNLKKYLTEGKLQEASRDYDFNSYYIDQIKRDLE